MLKNESYDFEIFETFEKRLKSIVEARHSKSNENDNISKLWKDTFLDLFKRDISLLDESLLLKTIIKYEEKYKEVTGLQPSDYIIINGLGFALCELAKIKQREVHSNLPECGFLLKNAIKLFQKMIWIKPNDAIIFNDFGLIFYESAKIIQNKFLFEEAIKKFEKATKLKPDYADAFNNLGIVLYELARNESQFKEAIEKFEKATKLKFNYADAFSNWGLALYRLARIKLGISITISPECESLFEEAIEKFKKAVEFGSYNARTYNGWGLVLLNLGRINKSLFQDAIKKFKEAIKIDPEYVNAISNLAEIYYELYLIEKEPDEKAKCLKKAEEYLKLAKRDIVNTFVYFDKVWRNKIIKVEFFYPLLDDSNIHEGKFFKETIGKMPKDHLDKYKEIYILSIFIISQLHVNNENEKLVAHYKEKNISLERLFENSKFRLNDIDYSNDPAEGTVLLDYLFGSNPIKSKIYGAFAACFTFNHDSLNQFRLYGKGMGLSLVFRDSFFSKTIKMATEPNEIPLKDKNIGNTLFRCIYVDPIRQRVETVGRKEKYLFYKEGNEDNIEQYEQYIQNIIDSINEEMKKLKKLTQCLDPNVIGQLLIHLRYLTKHIAFKEEQECRIIEICSIDDERILTDNFRMYIEYEPKAPNHIEKIYFGPKATGIEMFRDFLKHKDLVIPCENSENNLS